MKRLCLLLLFSALTLFSREIKPAFVMHTRGLVSDFVIDGLKLYVANDEGSVEIFDLRVRKKTGEIFIPPIQNDPGVWISPKILSVDRHNGKTLIVSTAPQGYRRVWLHESGKLTPVITTQKRLAIKEARFIDDKNFIFGTLGHDMIRYTLDDDYSLYRQHLEESAFSDMVLSEDKKLLASASESGRVTLMDLKTGKILDKSREKNLDNIYKIAMQNGTIITAGQDRRVAVYPKQGTPYTIKSDFLVYSVGLSPSGKLGIYSANENNDLQLFDIRTGAKLHLLKGHKAVPTTIKFFNEDGLFSAGDENTIYYWYLKEYNTTHPAKN
ncbi:MAG: nitrate reductase [Sulfurospirillum sp.]|nr:MAG: nitrate reductase [Sulfurospirillum sp.]